MRKSVVAQLFYKYQYSHMATVLSEQTSIFGVCSLYPSLFWELRDKLNLKILQS